jgi:hypothetical protein
MTYRPRGKVFHVFSLSLLAVIIVTACTDSRIPGVDIGIVLRCDIVGHTIDDEVCNNFGEV